MDNDVRAIISELVHFLNRAPGSRKDPNYYRSIQVHAGVAGASFSAYLYDNGIANRLPSGKQKVHSAPAERTARIQLDVYYGR